MSLQRPPAANRLREFTSASSLTTFDPPIGWIHVLASGDVVLKDEAGTAFTLTGCVGGEVYEGPFKEFTSTTCSRIRMGDGEVPVAALATVGTSAATSLENRASTDESVQVSADTSLVTRTSTSISTVTSTTTSTTSRLSTEESANTSANTSLTTRDSALTSISTSLETRLSTETSTRASADTSLTTRISIAESVEASKG